MAETQYPLSAISIRLLLKLRVAQPSLTTLKTASQTLKIASMLVILLLLVMLQGCDSRDVANQHAAKQTPASQNSSAIHADAIHADKSLNVVSPDWGIAATLTDMGYPPIATGDIRVWHRWVGKPRLPNDVTDLGIRYQPNAELVAQLPVDMVLDNYFYEHARNLYGDVATDSVLYFSEGETAVWQDYVTPTQKLGRLIQKPDAADTYIANSQAKIEQAGQRLHQRYPNVDKFAVVQFVDANNMRMYANNSLFNVAFSMMGFEFVALDKGNSWGFAPIQLGDLAKLDDDVCLLIIEPLSPLTQAQLQQSLVWQRLGYGSGKNANATADTTAANNSRCMAKLAPIWIYGGMSSLTALADNLATAELTGGVIQ